MGNTDKHIAANMDVSTIQERIADMARRYPGRGLTSLNRYLTEDWLKAAFGKVRKDAAAGVDGIMAREYEGQMASRLPELVNLVHSGRYVAPPVRRTYIEKPGKSEKRPLGIPTVEDKVLQRAAAMLIEPIYEAEFYDFSYGFRPGRSAHDAITALHNAVMSMGTGWILDVDIRKFFDTLDHGHMQAFARQRVRDGVLTRLIGKWLNAGVLEDGKCRGNEYGTPQGGVISPLLANIYLHEVLDKWFAKDIQPRLRGRCFLIRYADDFVMGFERKEDAERVLEVLPKRLGKYGLEIHAEKTRLVDFRRPRTDGPMKDHKAETFDFLGFTHHWGKSLNRQYYVMRHRTAKGRLKRALCAINQWCSKHRHDPLREQWKMLNVKLKGHYGYYSISGNQLQVHVFREQVRRYWFKWLNRRHRRRDSLDWAGYEDLLKVFPLATPYCVCKQPTERNRDLKNRMR
jgi:RNA-directed DNA polymerase